MNERYLTEDIFNILRLLYSSDDVSQRDLSSQLNFSLGKTNYLLHSLISKGLIKINNFATHGQKIGKIKYYLTPKGLEQKIHLTYYFLKQKEVEYLSLKAEVEKTKESLVSGG